MSAYDMHMAHITPENCEHELIPPISTRADLQKMTLQQKFDDGQSLGINDNSRKKFPEENFKGTKFVESGHS